MKSWIGWSAIILITVVAVSSCQSFRSDSRKGVENSAGDKVAVDTEKTTIINDVAPRYPGTPDFPAVAMIMNKRNNRFFQNCTGTLISKNVVLTAGHCICTKDPNLSRYESCGIGKSFAPETEKPTHLVESNYLVFFQHSGFYKVRSMSVFRDAASGSAYDVSTVEKSVGDLGVLVLDREVENIGPATLVGAGYVAPKTTPSIDMNAVVAGFGAHDFDDGISDTRSGIKLHALTRVMEGGAESCLQGSVPNGAICAKAVTFDKQPAGAICGGDSGGPLFSFEPALSGPMRRQKFLLWGVNNVTFDGCKVQGRTRHMDLSNRMYSKWVNNMVQQADNDLAAAAGAYPVPAAADVLAPVFNDDSTYFISSDPKTSAGTFEKGFVVLDNSGRAGQNFEVNGLWQLMRVSVNQTSVNASAPASIGALSFSVEKIGGGGGVTTRKTYCNRNISAGSTLVCTAAAGPEIPALTSGVFSVTPGNYRVEVTGDPKRAVQFVAIGYIKPNNTLASGP